ncbi:MAG: hypothetical protein HYZ53_03550 [Planctomycetes bacterium]|nr:hypothetical protein [Planctomycetota bacterium]
MTKKQNAAFALAALTVSLVAVGVVAPDLGYFLKANMDSMFTIGKTVGSALGTALGNPIFGLLGMILFIA